jgi:AcrR family transcriptional regulator
MTIVADNDGTQPGHPRARKEPATPRGGVTRTTILENSARLFALKGFDGTSLQDIADAMGLTRQSVYHYFRSKEELLATLVAESSELTADRLRAINRAPDLEPVEKLRQVTAEIVRERMEHPERFRMLERSESSLPEPIASAHRAARRAVLSEVSAVIAEGIRGGQFRECDERVSALALLGMCNWIAWWYRPDGLDSPEHVLQTLVQNAVAMLEEPGGPPAEPGLQGAFAQLRRDIDRLERLAGDEQQEP